MYQKLSLVLAFLVGSFGYGYVFGQCSADCRTAFYLTNPSNLCRRFRFKDTGTPATHAWNGVGIFNQVNTEKQPANTTGKKIRIIPMYKANPTAVACIWTCGAAQQPQEVLPGTFIEQTGTDADQRKCTPKGSS